MTIWRGRPKVSTEYCESVPTTSMRLIFGLAVGLDAQLDRHVEEVEVLLDLPDGPEAFVVAQTVDGVFVGELRGLRCRRSTGEEGGELLLRL